MNMLETAKSYLMSRIGSPSLLLLHNAIEPDKRPRTFQEITRNPFPPHHAKSWDIVPSQSAPAKVHHLGNMNDDHWINDPRLDSPAEI